VSLAKVTDEWQLGNQAIGIDRGWEAADRLVSTLELPGQQLPASLTPCTPHAGAGVLGAMETQPPLVAPGPEGWPGWAA
jgi:hypothetical protein